jgi:hypothetical protein
VTTPSPPSAHATDEVPGSSVPVTYGELMDGARLCAARAQRAIARTAFADADAARYVLTARARLLAAVAHHGEITIGPLVVQAWRDSAPAHRGVEQRDRRVLGALAWLDTLHTRAPGFDDQAPVVAPESGRSPAGVHLDRARALVAAASDLIATHRGPDGALLPTAVPAMGAADAVSLLSAPARLAAMAGAGEPLALRCRQAGLARDVIDNSLPLGDPITAASWDLAAALRFPASAVAPVTAHAAGPDTSSPAAEWRSRLDRIATRLRAAQSRGRISVRTLNDVATLGLVTSHVLATSPGSNGDPAPDTPMSPALGPVGGPVTEQWRALTAHLAPLRSTEPADRVIREDVDRLLAIAHPGSTTDPPQSRQLLQAIRASLPTLDACSAVAGRLLAASADAWVPAKPRRPYLPDLHRPGHAARAVEPPPTGFPRMGSTIA